MAFLEKYPSYVNSGESWIQEIPSHWKLFRFKYVFEITKRIVGELGHDVLSITQKGIKVKDTESGAGQLAMDYSKYQQVDRGDFAMNHMDLLTGFVDISKYYGVISPDYRVFKLTHLESDPKYFLYILQLCYKQRIFFKHGKGVSMIGRWRLPAENFKNFVIAMPPKGEQIKIAAFLDYKLAKVDRFILKKKQLIKLLNEQKSAIINQAVTKGIDPNAKMKPSGIEWLGDIPEHWEVRKLKTIVSQKITDGPHETPEFVKNGIPFISAEAVNGDGTISFDNRRADISKELDEIYSLKCKPQREDVFIVKSGSTTGKIGFVSTDLDFNIWSPLALVRSKKGLISGEYTFRTLQSPYFQMQVKTKWSFGTQPNIGMGILETLYVIVPPIEEQVELLEYINEEVSTIFHTISTVEKEIALTQEYRTALIAEAVTGKIDVRGFEVPAQAAPEDYEELEEELGMVAEEGDEYETEE